MISYFDRDGLQFQYPNNWKLELEESGLEFDEDAAVVAWTAVLQSGDLAFLLVSLRPDAASASELADQTLAALREEYPELDATNVVVSFAGLPAIGHDIDFLTLDTAIVCRTRCVDTLAGPLLVMTQVSEFDRDKNELVLDAMCQSMRIVEE
jgi:hypothetical protein